MLVDRLALVWGLEPAHFGASIIGLIGLGFVVFTVQGWRDLRGAEWMGLFFLVVGGLLVWFSVAFWLGWRPPFYGMDEAAFARTSWGFRIGAIVLAGVASVFLYVFVSATLEEHRSAGSGMAFWFAGWIPLCVLGLLPLAFWVLSALPGVDLVPTATRILLAVHILEASPDKLTKVLDWVTAGGILGAVGLGALTKAVSDEVKAIFMLVQMFFLPYIVLGVLIWQAVHVVL